MAGASLTSTTTFPCTGLDMQEAIMTHIPNRPGELARITAALGEANVNITALYVNAHGEQGTVCLVCDNTSLARKALERVGAEVDVRTVHAKRLPNRPGALAAFTQQLAREGVNIRQVIGSLTRSATEADIYFELDDPAKGERFFV